MTFGFVLLAALAGLPFGVVGAAVTLVVLTAVVLGQELPRAWLACALGRSAEVHVSVHGTFTRVSGEPLSKPAAIAFEFIGSAVNLVTAASAIALWRSDLPRATAALIEVWGWSHLVWGLGQALPLIPFHAGRALAVRTNSASLRFLSAVVPAALLLTVGLFMVRTHWPALVPITSLAAFMALAEGMRIAAESGDQRSGALSLATRAARHLREGDAVVAAQLAEQGLGAARSPRIARRLRETLVWAAIAQREPIVAHVALSRLQESAIDYHLLAAYLSCCNRIDEAVQILREARELGHRNPESTKLLIDLLYRSGDNQGALAIARADAILLSADDRQVIATALP